MSGKDGARRRGRATATELVDELDDALRAAGRADRAEAEKRYLKSPLEHYGASVPAIRVAVRELTKSRGPFGRRTLLALVRRLWSSPVHEQRMAAVLLLEEQAADLAAGDLALIERMIRESFTWAYVDNLAATTAGYLVERYPELCAELDRWIEDDVFWVRRAAMLALLLPLRRGEGDWKRLTRFADRTLDEREFFIRKAIGWVLRDTSKRRPELVKRYVASRLDRLSPLTFREATKRLAPADREELRAAYESAR